MRRNWKSRLVAILVGAAATITPVTAATADEDRSNNDNVAIAINTENDTEKFRIKYTRDRVDPGEDDPDNAAWAQSSCERCKTTAIAIQIALVERPVDSDFQPTNLAFAINQQCTQCETVALAHQVVREVEPNVVLTDDGKERIANIVDKIRALKHEGLTPPELDAAVKARVEQIKTVLDEQLRPRGDASATGWDDSDMATAA